jgi:hypothetical protein
MPGVGIEPTRPLRVPGFKVLLNSPKIRKYNQLLRLINGLALRFPPQFPLFSQQFAAVRGKFTVSRFFQVRILTRCVITGILCCSNCDSPQTGT